MRKALAILAALLALATTQTLTSASTADYPYSFRVTVTNATGSAVAGRIPFSANTLNLINGKFLNASATNMLLTDSAAVVADGMVQGVAGNSTSWWIDVNVPNNATREYIVYMGSSAPVAEREQGFYFEAATTTLTVANDASLNWVIGYPIEIVADVDLPAAVGAGETLILLDSGLGSNNYKLWLAENGKAVFETVDYYGGGPCTLRTAASAFTTGRHTVRFVMTGGATTPTAFEVDGVDKWDSAVCASVYPNPNPTGLRLGVMTGGLTQATFYSASLAIAGTSTLDLAFTPDLVTETDKGDAGDGWTYEGTVTDQSPSTNDASYVIIKNATNLTISVGPLSFGGGAAVPKPTVVPPKVIGVSTDTLALFTPPAHKPSPIMDAVRLMADSGLMPAQAWWLLLAIILSIAGSALVFRFMPSLTVAGGFFGAAFVVMILIGDTMNWWIFFLAALWIFGSMTTHKYWASGG